LPSGIGDQLRNEVDEAVGKPLLGKGPGLQPVGAGLQQSLITGIDRLKYEAAEIWFIHIISPTVLTAEAARDRCRCA
jgi:hypothetical protein